MSVKLTAAEWSAMVVRCATELEDGVWHDGELLHKHEFMTALRDQMKPEIEAMADNGDPE